MASPIVFYDIAMRPPVEESCFSPNPWKSRLALNFKKSPYTTTWVPLPDIAKVRSGLNVPASRKFADGTDFYTLPVINDPATGTLVGDSFDIAVYLQKTYPDSGAGDLFPPQTLEYDYEHNPLIPLTECHSDEYPEYAKFNMKVDGAFTAHTPLAMKCFPFDPATAEISKAEFARRAGVPSWDAFALTDEMRTQMLDSFKDTLGGLAKLFVKDTSGPFILGSKTSYADMIVGAWLRMMYVALPPSEWEQLRGWHDGVFGQLHDALDKYAEVK